MQNVNSNSQKQLFADVFQNRFSEKSCNIHRKRRVLESLFIKKRLQLRSFPVNTAKFLRTAFTILYRTCLVAASELKSNVSNTNLHKNKQKLFLYFHNSHANQTNTTKKIRFFLIHY